MAFDAYIKAETIRGVIRICVERGWLFGVIRDKRIREWIYVGGGSRMGRTAELRGVCVSPSPQRWLPQRDIV